MNVPLTDAEVTYLLTHAPSGTTLTLAFGERVALVVDDPANGWAAVALGARRGVDLLPGQPALRRPPTFSEEAS